jgi:hypothetical protein
VTLLPEQIRHEEAIAAAQRALAVAHGEQIPVFADLLTSLVRARDPDVKRQLEEARMRRVGL